MCVLFDKVKKTCMEEYKLIFNCIAELITAKIVLFMNKSNILTEILTIVIVNGCFG